MDAGADETRSAYEFTHMQCNACGHGGLVDSWERDSDWLLEIERGCSRCSGDDAASAWDAMLTTRVRSLVQESHFGVQITACSCGQRFAVVFTERIDWRDGEDEQDWVVLPIFGDEPDRLAACTESELRGLLAELGRERRFLVRSHPSGAPVSAWWRQGGFAIGPHD